ncbi:phage tail protein [Streptococcus sp. 27098_8_186]|uniref:phage tail protein n=1 Tax=Streptococcus sp. 27098_8_186 TaxID=3003650 RepID=UPI00352F48F6
MITFYDERGNGYGAQVELTTKNAVNGERSISGTIVSNKQVLSRLDRGWSFTFDGELYKIIYAKPKDEGKNISLSFDAVHQFFYDFEHSNCYQEFNGSNRFEVYIEAIFKNSGYRYVIEAQAGAIRKENFGNTKRLSMFKDIIKAAGLEFSVTGKVVRIVKKVGTDLSTVVRKNFNMNELTLEKNIGAFITYKKGLGAWKDENNHDAGRYTSEYESPLARIYGRIEGEPVTDERYKDTGKLLERLKKEVDESYSISIQLDMEDLTQAGYKYTRPRAGDYIMAINETIGFREKIRIVSYESSYDVTGRLLSHKVTCNDIGTVQKAITSEGSIMRSVSESREYAEGALEVATRALVSANSKNTNYYGTTKPKDEPRGTLHEGDLLYLTVGEETELYYWSGTEWLPKILKVDTSKIEKIVSDAQTSANQAIAQANAKADESLKKAGTSADLAKEAKAIANENVKNLNTFKVTAEQAQTRLSQDVTTFRNEYGSKMLEVDQTTAGIKTKIGEITSFIDKDDQRQEELKRYAREETASLSTTIRETLSRDYVAKSTFTENAEGTRQRFEALTRDNEAKLAEFKQGIDGQLTTLSSQIAGKVNETDFQKVKETSLLYERIIGTSETDAPDKLSRLVMSSEIFQTEVGKYVTDDNNLIVNSMTMSTNTLVGNNNPNANVSVSDGIFTIKAQGLTGYNWTGFSLPIYVKKIYHGETYTLGFKYRIREYPDSSFAFNVKNHGLNKILLSSDIGKNRPPLNEWQEFQKTFTVQEDFAFGEDVNYPFYIYLAKNGWVEFKEPILVRGSNTGPYKPSQFDDAYKASNRAKELASDAQAKAIQVAEQAKQAKETAEATRTQVTQLAGSWSVRNLNSAGDVLGQLNLNPDGSIRINEGLLSVGEKTIIKNGVIKKSMIGNAQIGTAHISEIDASQARLINVSAKNIVADGLTANIIKGGTLSSLNGITDFNLQTGWIEMNKEGVGIKNQFANRPLQYLVFGSGRISGKDGSYTALMSNSRKHIKMDDGSAGIQIWNANDNTTAVNIYGDLVEFMYNANDPKSIAINTVDNTIHNIEDIIIKNKNLVKILDNIFDNFRNLDDGRNYTRGGYYKYWR